MFLATTNMRQAFVTANSMIQTLIKSIIRPREITEWCKCTTDHEESEGFHREILGIKSATSISPEFHLGITYGAHEISNLDDSRRNKRVES